MRSKQITLVLLSGLRYGFLELNLPWTRAPVLFILMKSSPWGREYEAENKPSINLFIIQDTSGQWFFSCSQYWVAIFWKRIIRIFLRIYEMNSIPKSRNRYYSRLQGLDIINISSSGTLIYGRSSWIPSSVRQYKNDPSGEKRCRSLLCISNLLLLFIRQKRCLCYFFVSTTCE